MKILYPMAVAQLACPVSRPRLVRRCISLAAIALANLALLGITLAWLAPAVQAASFGVGCGDVAGLVSALIAANGNGQADTITLAAGCVYTLTAIHNTEYGPNGLPAVSSPITIVGNGATLARGGSAPNFRFFYVGAGGSLTLDGLTLSGGQARGGAGGSAVNGAGGGGAGLGGAIFNQGRLTMQNSTLTNNQAHGGDGGSTVWTLSDGGAGGGGLGGDGGAATDAGGAGGGGFGGRGGDSAGGGGGGGGNPNNGANASGNTGGAGGTAGGGKGGNGCSFLFCTAQAGTAGTAGGGGGGGGGRTSLAVGAGPTGGAGGAGGGGGGGGRAGDAGASGENGGDGGGGGFGGGGGSGGGANVGSANNDRGGNGGAGGFGGGGGGGSEGNTSGGSSAFGGGAGGNSQTDVSGGGGGGGAGLGGAIFNYGGVVTLTNTTLAGNSAHGGAGGNSARGGSGGSGLGGAIFNEQGALTMQYVTLAGNGLVAGSAGTGSVSNGVPGSTAGGALYNHGGSGSAVLTGTVLVGSSGGNDCRNDGGTVAASAQNLMGTHSGCGTPTTTSNPLLGPLADNGGPAWTMALLSGSPAIDAGTCLAGLTADQRGIVRPQGSACDLGAYELGQPRLALSKTVAPASDVAIHGAVTYTLVISNSGAADASAALLTDTLAMSTTFARWVLQPAGASQAGDRVTWGGTVAAGQAVTLSFVATQTGGYGEAVTNLAHYSHASGSGDASATFTVVGAPHLDLSPASLDFGSYLVGTTSAPLPVSLGNSGAASLDIALAVGGDFAIQGSDCPASLGGGASCTVQIVFSPSAIGSRTGVLTVTTNAPGSPGTVALSGVGAAPGLLLNKTVTPTLKAAYHGPVTYTVILANSGTGDASAALLTDTLAMSTTFARWVLQPAGASRAGDRVTWGGTVAAGQAVTLSFVATQTGGYGEAVTNLAHYSHASGSGDASATFTVVGAPHLDLSPASLDFGAEWVGAPGPTRTITLANTGQATLDLAVLVSGDYAVQATTCPASLAGGDACTLDVSFSPAAAGPRPGAVTVTSNDPANPSAQVTLAGDGRLRVSLSKTVTPAAGVGYHGLVTYTLVLSNASPAPAAATLLTDTLPAAVDFARWVVRPAGAAVDSHDKLTWNGTLPAGQALTFTFVVSHVGAYGDEVVNTAVYSQAYSEGGAGQATFSVIGPPVLSLSDASLDFGNQLVGTTSPARTIALTNTGAAALDLGTITASGDFSVTHTCPASLGSGAGCTLDLTFTPVISGPRSGSLAIASNAATSPDTVGLTGVGTMPSLLIGKQATPALGVAYHGEVTYTVALANVFGTADAVGTVLTDALPFGTVFARWVDNPCGAIYDTDQITWQGTVTAGQYISFTFVVTHTGTYSQQVINVVSYTQASGSGRAEALFVVGPYRVYVPIVLKETH